MLGVMWLIGICLEAGCPIIGEGWEPITGEPMTGEPKEALVNPEFVDREELGGEMGDEFLLAELASKILNGSADFYGMNQIKSSK